MITPTQQSILDSLVNEFNRINNESPSSDSFNFINTNPLIDKSREIKDNEAIADADYQAWRKMAIDEADRLVVLLRQDLPNAYIFRHSKENGFHESPTIKILRNNRTSTHHESCVSINVNVVKEKCFQTHGCYYQKGVRLAYSESYLESYPKYETMQDLANSSNFQEQIRRKVL
jgi:hypothetical protein